MQKIKFDWLEHFPISILKMTRAERIADRKNWQKFGLATVGKLEDGASLQATIGEPIQFEYVGIVTKKIEKKLAVRKEEEEPKKEVQVEEKKTKSYVPPALRGQTSLEDKSRERDDANTIRVSNLSEDVEEYELRDMFAQCGLIQRCFLGRDKETGISKGFAFITYRFDDSVDLAIAKFDGKGLYHMILSVERSKPKPPMK